MRQATNLEIKHYIDYRSKHVALVQRLGKLAFNEDFSTHDHDKLELDGGTLSKFALWFAYINGEYEPTARDIKILKNLNIKHYLSQKHHPEYWDVDITLSNFTEDMSIKATRMSKKAMKEMVCDWTACCLYKNQPVFKFFNKTCTGDNPKFVFTLNQKNFIIECLTKLQNIIKKENISWAGKEYTAEQIEPLREGEYLRRIPVVITDEKYEEIIHSPSFKAWFGDWENDPEHASKVVDEKGKPLIVYHGSRTGGFASFSDNGEKQSFAPDGSYWFTDEIYNAVSYSGTTDFVNNKLPEWAKNLSDYEGFTTEYETSKNKYNVIDKYMYYSDYEPVNYACFLNIRDPFVYNFEGCSWDGTSSGKYCINLLDEEGYFIEPFYREDGTFLFDSESEAFDFAEENNLGEEGKDFEIQYDAKQPWDTNEIALNGKDCVCDGVIIKNVYDVGSNGSGDEGTDFIVYNPKNIKSIDNLGSWSSSTDNIYESSKLRNEDKDQLQKFCDLVADPEYSLENHDLHESYFNSGYDWKKGMSNRAVQAYHDGKMPISYWRNNATLNSAIENESMCEDEEAIKILIALPIEAKLNLLTDNDGEYHHTGKYYNTTYFYEMRDLSSVSAKDAEDFKQQWEEYSKAKRDYNKFVKENVDETKGIIETESGVKKVTVVNAFEGIKLPKEIISFLKKDLEYSQSGSAYIKGTKPTHSQCLDNTIPEGTLKLCCYDSTLMLMSYNTQKMDYDTISSIKLKTNIDYTDIRKLKVGKYEGTKKSTYLKLKPKWTVEIKGTLTEKATNKNKNFVYMVMSSDGRFIPSTETTDLDVAKKYRQEYEDHDDGLWYSIKKIPLKECETSGAVSGGNSTNCSSSFTAQAPENIIKMFIPQGDDVLKDIKLKEFRNTAIAQLKESIIDVPQKEYYKGVLTEEDKMNPVLRKQIIQTIYDWTQLIDFDFNVYKIVAKGSLLTKRYNDTTDLDITVYTDLSKEQLDSIYSLIPRGENIKIDGEETSHAIDIYILTKGEKSNIDDIDNLYDVAKDKWIKRSEEYDSEIPLNYALEVANFFINGCTIALSNYHNDKIMYDYYNSLDTETQEITIKEKSKALAEVKSSLQADLDGMKLALYMISSFRQDVYGENANPFHISIDITSDNPHNSLNEVMTKLIEKFNIKEDLKNCVKECEELLGTESMTESIDGKTVAFTFGRMNVPTVGHLLLLTKLATTTADEHYVYTSHSHDKKKNPLDYATKASLIQTIIKENNLNLNFINTEAKTIIDVAIDMYEKGFKNIIFVGGSDTAEEICTLLNKYNDVPNKEGKSYHFDSITYVVAGIRNPDSDDVDGVSATKVRQFAKDNDFENFSKYLAVKDKHIAKEVFEEVKKEMK